MTSINEQRLVSKEVRNFLEYWTTDYGFTKHGDKIRCGLCSEVIIGKTFSVKRHFESKHKDIAGKSIDERREIISQHLKAKMTPTNEQNFNELDILPKYIEMKNFKQYWTTDYGFTQHGNKSRCGLCFAVIITKTSSMKRHFESKHQDIAIKDINERREIISQRLKLGEVKSNFLSNSVNNAENMEETIDETPYMMTIDSKPFTESNNFMNIICRVCMSTKCSKLHSIYNVPGPEDSVKIIEMLIAISAIPTNFSKEDDDVPKSMCEDCLDVLKKSYDFQQKCINSYNYFKNIMQKTKPSTSHIINEKSNQNIDSKLDGILLEDVSNSSFCKISEKDVEIELKLNLSKEKNNVQEIPKGVNAEIEHVICDKYSKIIKRSSTSHIFNENSIQKINNFSVDASLEEISNSSLQKNLNDNVEINVNMNLNPQKNSKRKIFEDIIENNEYQLLTNKSESQDKKQEDIINSNKEKLEINSSSLPKTYDCTMCDKKYKTSSSLKNHLNIHTKEKQFLCSECGKTFNNSSNLKEHIKRHLGIKRFECSECPSKFLNLSYLKRHMNSHSQLKPYVCDTCGSAYTRSYKLLKHKQIHTGIRPYVCSVCKMSFYKSDSLKRHQRKHTGERPFQCQYCSKSYVQRNDLIKHKRTHLGENIYKCEECPMSFRFHAELKLHNQEHFKQKKLLIAGNN